MLPWVAFGITLFIGLVLIVFLLTAPSAESARLLEVTRDARMTGTPVVMSRLEGVLDADRIARILGPLSKIMGGGKDTELHGRLSMAGYRKPSHADIFYSAKVVLPVVGGLAAALLIRENTIFWIVVAAAVGFLAPDLWLMRAISKRKDEIRFSLPDALDLLIICMEAGLGLDQAIVRVGHELRITHPALSDEFMLINLEQRAGKVRVDAWRHMADRTGLESVRSFVHMLVQTERFGTPISKSLGAFADALRIRRRQQAEEMAAKTTIKLIPPLVLFIFPSLFIVLLGPAVITIYRNLGKVLAE